MAKLPFFTYRRSGEYLVNFSDPAQISRPNYVQTILIVFLSFFSIMSAVYAKEAGRSHLHEIINTSDAVHLLNRTGIGAHPGDIERLLGLTRKQAIEDIIGSINKEPTSPMPPWVDQSPIYQIRASLEINERRQFNNQRNQEFQELKHWWLREMIETRSPQTERLVLFWHNHFVSSYPALGNHSTSIARQNALFRQLAGGSFREMLRAIIRDAAMLDYLDNRNSNKRSPNENLARELLELFTLGEGNYTESDVKNAARALTGYTLAPTHNLSFRFDPQRHDKGEKELFGQKGKFNGDDLIQLILERPESAIFIASRFWNFYVSNDFKDSGVVNHEAAEALVKIADRFRTSDYNISVLLQTLLEQEEFWVQENRLAIVKSPIDLVLGTVRSHGQPVNDLRAISSTLEELSQELFAAPNVAGWPGGSSWVTSGLLLKRIRWLEMYNRQAKELSSELQTQPMISNNSENMQSLSNDILLSQSRDSFSDTTMMMVDPESSIKVDNSSTSSDVVNKGVHIGKVYLQLVTHPEFPKGPKNKRNQGKIAFTLLDVQVGERYWNNIHFEISRSPNGLVTFILDNYACWPQCADKWPDCAIKQVGDPAFRKIRLIMDQSQQGNVAGYCNFEELGNNLRRLMAGLIDNTIEFHSKTVNDRRLSRRQKSADHATWRKYLVDSVAKANAGHAIDSELRGVKATGIWVGKPAKSNSNSDIKSTQPIYPASTVLRDLTGNNADKGSVDSAYITKQLQETLLNPHYQLK